MNNKYLLNIVSSGCVVILLILMLMVLSKFERTRKMLKLWTLIILKLLGLENLISFLSKLISKDKYDSGIYIPINNYFIYNIEKKEIIQKLTKGYELNDFDNSRKVLLRMLDISSDKRKYLNHEVITFTTNKGLYRGLYRKNKTIIESVEEGKTFFDNQYMERIRLIDGKVLRKSVFDKELRSKVKRFLYKEVEMCTYTIKLK